MRKEVGQFSIEDGTFSGPAEYMREQGNAKLDGILAGTDTAFNLCAGFSPDTETAILVAMQTDYAGWIGMRELLSALAPSERRGEQTR